MKITCKTLQQKQFQVDVDPSSTVAGLKESISKSQGFDVSLQKLIYSGKVLADEKVIAEIGIKDKDFVVVMVSKPKAESKPAAAPAAAPTASTSAPTAPALTSAPAAASTTAVQADASSTASAATPAAPASGDTSDATAAAPATSSAPESTPAAAAAAAPAPPSADPGFLVGSHLQTTIDEIVNGMGFPRDQVVKAMRAAFNNPDRAVEYLMTGIPAGLGEAPPGPSGGGAAPPSGAPAAPAAAGAAAPAAAAPPNPNAPRNLFEAAAQHAAAQRQGGAGAGAGAAGAPAAGAGGDLPPNLEALRNNPQLAQLRQLVQQNPALLQPFLQQLGASNPALLRQINANPQLLMQFLGAGTDEMGDFGDDDFLGNLGGEGGAAGGGAAGGPGGAGGAPGGGQYVQVTEEERAAIDRLTAMGFERDMVIQAFFACDKNEEVTANYLVEHGFDDYDDGDMQS